MSHTPKILEFVDLLHKFRAIERRVLVRDSERSENDVEHSYSLAMLAWFLNDTCKLGLNEEKLFKYALAHDLVEIHAGDTFFYADSDLIQTKQEREEEAAHKLKEEYSEFSDLHKFIEGYEKKEDEESRFIYALDKIEPILNIYLDGGRTWRKDNVTLEMLTSAKASKVALSPKIEEIFNELISMLKEEESRLFSEKV